MSHSLYYPCVRNRIIKIFTFHTYNAQYNVLNISLLTEKQMKPKQKNAHNKTTQTNTKNNENIFTNEINESFSMNIY